MSQHKHALIGTDQQGDSCIYVVHIEPDGTTGKYLSAELLQVIADRINSSRIGLKPGAALGALRKERRGWPKGKPRKESK